LSKGLSAPVGSVVVGDEEREETSTKVNELIVQGLDLNLSQKDIDFGSELRQTFLHGMNTCLSEVGKLIKDRIPEDRIFEVLRHLSLLKFMSNDENVEKAKKLAKLYKI